jgi:hypothetical protein
VKVFISHSFLDKSKFDELSALLNEQKIPFFKPSDMKGTASLANQLNKAITDCDICIFVATHNSVKSDWCHAELGAFWGWGDDKGVIIFLADSSLEEQQLPDQFKGHYLERDILRVVDHVKTESLTLPTQGFTRARKVHGYSGKWDVKAVFKRWRDRDVGPDESVIFNGETSLFLQTDGESGWGMQKGILQVDLRGYHVKLRVCNEVLRASINEEGKVDIKLKVFHRGIIQQEEGTPPDDLGKDWLKDVDNAPSFDIELEPSVKPKIFLGHHKFKPGEVTHQIAEEEWTYSK